MRQEKQAIRWKALIYIAKVLIAAGLLTWLVVSGRLDFGALLSAPLNLFHVLGLLALLVHMFLQAVRWWWLLEAQNVNLSLGNAIQLTWIGQFFSLVLLGAAGGELVRAYYVVQDVPAAKLAGISTVLLDRAMGVYALLWLGIPSLLVLILQNELTSTVIQLGAVISLLLIGTSMLFLTLWIRPTRNVVLGLAPRRFRAPLEATLEAYKAHGRYLLACFALSLLGNITLMGVFLLASKIIDTPLGWQQVFLVGPLVTLANSLPITPGGVGVAEATASFLFGQFSVQTGAEIMLIVRLWLYLLGVPGGLIYVFYSFALNARELRQDTQPEIKACELIR